MKKNKIKYIHYCKHKNSTMTSISSMPKQSLILISVAHTNQFSEHTNSFKYRSLQAVIHTLKHEFLIDNWHLMNRMSNRIRPALRVAPYWRLHTLKKYYISRYIANNFVFIVQTLSYEVTSPIHKYILQGQHITQ